MANDKISQLPAVSAADVTDLLPMVDVSASATKKATLQQLLDAMPDATPTTRGIMSAHDQLLLTYADTAAAPGMLVLRSNSGSADFSTINASQITVTGTPVNSTDATNKAYVDAVAIGLTVKAACRVATTANVATLAGGAPSVVDGVTLSTSDRVLVRSQSTASQNGIYTVSSVGSGSNGTWARATDADTSGELPTNSYTFVNSGTLYSSTGWVMNSPGPIVLGTTAITWVIFSQITSIAAANITGQLVAAQIGDAQVTTAKFASGITPVEIVNSLPVTSNFEGRTVYLTTDDTIYRYNGSSFTSSVAATAITGTLTNSQIADLAAAKLTGSITSTQITDSAVTTAKLNAAAVTTAKIAASAVTATEIAAGAITTAKLAAASVTSNELAANSVIAGKIAAAAVSTTELAANAVTAAKILANTITSTQIAASTILGSNIAATTITATNIATGTITADKMNVSTLSAITANVGTITGGTLSGWTLTSTTIAATVGSSSLTLDSTVPEIRVTRSLAKGALYTDDTGIGERARLDLTYNSKTLIEASASALTSGLIRMKDNSNFIRIDLQSATGLVSLKNSSGVESIGLTGGTGAISASTLAISGATIAGGGIGTTALQKLDIDLSTGSTNKVNISCGEVSGSDHTFSSYVSFWVNGRTVYIPFTTSVP